MRVAEGVGHACRARSSGLKLWARAPGYSEGQEGHHRSRDTAREVAQVLPGVVREGLE